MSWLEALILGLVQGITEFLPVSSSGHLTIGQEILGVSATLSDSDTLLFDVILHAATVLSTILVLWTEISTVLKGTFASKAWNAEKEYALKICISMIPIFVVGIFFKDYVEQIFGEGLLLVGCCLIITALLLAFAYYAKPRKKEDISRRDAFIIGVSQAIAVLPGLSRSGSTIATGLLLGNKKESVAKFSFLMVLVPILGEAALNVLKFIKSGTAETELSAAALVAGFVAAFASGAAACKLMLDLVKRGKLIYFSAYCLVIGAIAIAFAF